MKKLLLAGALSAVLVFPSLPLHADPDPPVDCACVQALPQLVITNCPAFMPDLAVVALPCFSTNVSPSFPGAVQQSFPAGFQLAVGTNTVTLTVTDNQSNQVQCLVEVVVIQPADPTLTLICQPDKVVDCSVGGGFDAPIVSTTCCDPVSLLVPEAVSTITNGTCPTVITRVWRLQTSCGHTQTCSQTITVVDNAPPVPFCGGLNLVPNGSFERYDTCPAFFSQVPLAAPWFNPTAATPDYFNACTPFPLVSTPSNFAGVQQPYHGQSYAGAIVYHETGLNLNDSYREYLAVPLAMPLVAGQAYDVSFRVSLSETSAWAVADIGAHLSVGPLSSANQGVLNVLPQVSNPGSQILDSTNTWMLIQGIFVAAGGEDHLTLGNYKPDPTTIVAPAGGTLTNVSYYYFDDVVVRPVCSPTVTNKVVLCGQPWSFDTPSGYDECSGTNAIVTLVGTVTNGFCGQDITRTWALSDACGNTTYWSQTVTIVDNEPPEPFCTTPNLVPNGGFEFNTSCPTALSQLDLAAPWYPATDGTPDAYKTCAPAPTVGVPTNIFGVQNPYTGEGYAGAYVYSLTEGTNLDSAYREYVQVPLMAPLVANQSYPVSFRVCLAELAGQAIAEIGAHFSVGPVTNYDGYTGVLDVVPQVANPSANVITSTNAWVLIQGNYTAAGGETHLTIGNFNSDAATTALPAGGSLASHAYYYIDDVRVGPPCPGIPPEIVVPCGEPLAFDLVTGYDACAGTNLLITITDVTNSVCPLVVTRTWTLSDPCGNSTNVSQTAFVVDSAPPSVDCACVLAAVEPLLFTNGCPAYIPDFSFLTNSACLSDDCGPLQVFQSPPAGFPAVPGPNPITLTIADCGGNTTNCTLHFEVFTQPLAVFCPPDLYLVGCSNGTAVAHYSASPGNQETPVVCTPPSGSVFPLGTNLVTCVRTGLCGEEITCTFNVIVRPPRPKAPECITKAVGIPVTLPGSALMRHQPDYPDDDSVGVTFENLGSNGEDVVRLEFGPVAEFTFTTTLDFGAPLGARLDLRLPPGGGSPGQTLLSFLRSTNHTDGWNILRPQAPGEPSTNRFRSVAIGTNGALFDSVIQDAATLDTNVLATLEPMNGMTAAVMTVTLDTATRGFTLAFPHCEWEPNARHKGWDGCIYGPDRPRPKKTNTTARLIFTPVPPVPAGPVTELELVASNLTSMAFENPSLRTTNKIKYGDGHIIIMKGFDDEEGSGLEFVSLGNGGTVEADIGHAAAFQFRLLQLENGPIEQPELVFRARGWPPGTTTNRPPPPTNYWRLTQGDGSSGVPGVELAADFTEWGVSRVTVQLWDGGVLVGESHHLPAVLVAPLVTLSGFPEIMGCPGVGVVSLRSTHPFAVLSGLDCPSGVCEGTELRILAELDATSTPPEAFTDLEIALSDGMALRLLDFETTPACDPVPLSVVRTAAGVTVSWSGDGFRLQGAEQVTGPWYDLGVSSPSVLASDSSLRLFRLLCD